MFKKRSICSLTLAPKRKSNQSQECSKKLKGDRTEQLLLDFGQKSLGKKIECRICSLVYCQGDPEDEKSHGKFCDPWINGVFLNAWKNERIVDKQSDGSRILEIRKDSPAFQRSKVQLIFFSFSFFFHDLQTCIG